MAEGLIETKLLAPRVRRQTVPRSRLESLLERGADAALTLVAAPAGFGKTTLLGSWLADRDEACAWVSLDERDADPASFWSHVLHALDRAVPGCATAAIAQLRSGAATAEHAVAVLVNELSVAVSDVTLVLDDYHLAESTGTQPGMALLVEHLPPQLHLVISSRVDPALPLARLRARGELVEVRAADLRFNADEATTYLNELNALELDPADVASLGSRTEGWVAALQLAALSLQGRNDRSQFIAGFAGDDRFVVDYLADEVLDHQTDDVRDFLLETSVLEELTPSLCDTVTGRAGSRAMLEALERANLFLVPLDDRRRRYRYHHLFADVLRAHLLDERPGDVAMLHRRASDWYDGRDEPEAAVRHALAAGELALAADLVERAVPALLRDRREALIRRWARELSPDVVRNRPVLAVGLVAGLMASNDFDEVDRRLDDVEELLAVRPGDAVVVDHAELERLPASVLKYRAARSLVSGDLDAAVRHAEHAMERASDDDHLSVAAASALVGLAAWAGGDLETAHRHYLSAAGRLERAGHLADVLACSITIADLELTLGRLGDAKRTFERVRDLAAANGHELRGLADVHVGLSRVAWEQGDLGAAAEHLRKVDELGDEAGLPQNPYRWRVMMARLRHAEGDTASAIGLLEDAQRVYVGDFSPDVQPIRSTRARLLVAAGDLAGARDWEQQVTFADRPAYLDEYDHLTLARLRLAEHASGAGATALRDATTALDGVLDAARAGGRLGTVLEALVLRALAEWAGARHEAAVQTLADALHLARPDGWVRVFTDEGQQLHELLRELVRHRPDDDFARALAERTGSRDARVAGSTRSNAVPGADLSEPLSGRELDVLRLLGSDLGGPDIARTLHVSLSTVRTHTQHIYTKLGVNNRRSAVRRAHQLGLFARSED